MDDTLRRRYARHIVLAELGEEGQQKLLNANVLVVGAGGLGSAALSYLAAGGVGHLGIVDADRVELSNLQRQIIHETGDIGHLKAASAQDRIEELNPHIEVTAYTERLEPGNAQSIISGYDLVIDASDNYPTRFLLNETCYALKKPLISAAVRGWSGQLSTFKAYLGTPHPCYRCFIPESPPVPQNCAESGVIGPLAGIMGALQALEAMKELTESGDSLSGRLMIFEGLKGQSRVITLPRDPECPICGGNPPLHPSAASL